MTMRTESTERVLWDRVALFALIAIAGGLFVWWLESRFGSLIAVMSLGLLGGALFFIAGALFAQRHTQIVLDNVSDFMADMADTEKSRQAVAREYARMEREAARAALTGEVLSARRVDQLAQERAKLLAAEPRAPTWQVDDQPKRATTDAEGFRFYE
jgi:hypothetical protein